MKNKSKTYLLLAAVLVIWGLIGYKIISAMSPELPEIQQELKYADFNPTTTTQLDTFSIQMVERDPFLGTVQVKKSNNISSGSIKKVKDTLWPNVSYGGLIKKQKSKDQIFVVNINSHQYLFKHGQTIQDFTLVKGSNTQIVLRYKNKQRTLSID